VKLLGRPDENVDREPKVDLKSHAQRPIAAAIAVFHQDHQIDVGVLIGGAPGMRAKKNNPLRMKSFGDFPGRSLDVAHRNHDVIDYIDLWLLQ